MYMCQCFEGSLDLDGVGMRLGLDPVPAVWDGDDIGEIGLLCLGVEGAEIWNK